jgi:hypothetical protein
VPSKVPEFIYVILESSRWAVTAIPDGPYAADQVAAEVERRVPQGDTWGMSHLHIYRCRVTEVAEVELIPAREVKAEIQVKKESP